MKEYYGRTINLIGETAFEKLRQSSVAIFGLGGVGSYAAETTARAGVGKITVIDGDVIEKSNINRQLIASEDNVGEPKTKVMAKRIKRVAPFAAVTEKNGFYPKIDVNLKEFDFIIDAIDDVAAKCELISNADKHNVPIISSMGAGNRLCPELFEIADVYETKICPLAKVMRKKLKLLGVKALPVVYSTEAPIKTREKNIIGSVSFVPAAAGLIMAGYVVRNLIRETSINQTKI